MRSIAGWANTRFSAYAAPGRSSSKAVRCSCRSRARSPSGSRRNCISQRIDWPEAHERLRRYYLGIGNQAEYARTTLILADAFPFTGAYQFDSAAALIALGRTADALRYSQRAVELEPRNVNHLLVRAHALLLNGRLDEGRGVLGQVLELEPGNATALDVMRQLDTKPL